mgnify:FL=1
MHSFLPAIGFTNIKNRQQLEPIYRQILSTPTSNQISTISSDTSLIQINKDFGDGFGISLIGEMSQDGALSIEYYFPYVKSNRINEDQNIYVEKFSDKSSYAGVSSDFSLGMSLIFFITNVADYVKSLWTNKPNKYFSKAYFSGLSTNGTIILDINKEFEQRNSFNNGKRNRLIEAAKKGDPDAIESLTLEDMDTYNLIGKRTRQEDVLTIVESSFMPVGIETDHYAVIGNITACNEKINSYTGESVYLLDIECNDLTFTVAINKNHLLGEPAPGRRFKGDIWLQGNIITG